MRLTNKGWYNLLSPKDKIKFNQNCDVNRYLLHTSKRSKKDFLNGAFIWNNTPQGHDYWSKIANSKD